MTDDPHLDPPDADEQRAALLHIIGYRHLRRAIRSSGSGSLVWGLILLGIWYWGYTQAPKFALSPLGLIHLGLAVLELGTGLAKKLTPVPETFLMEAGVFFAFAGANAFRSYLAIQGGGKPPTFSIVFGLYMLFAAIGKVREYLELNRTRFRRPSGEQLRWFDELLAEVRGADPEVDPNSLDLPTEPPLRAKLLGDTVLAMQPGHDDPAVLSRASFRIDRIAPRPDEKQPTGILYIEGVDQGDFLLDEFNWKNYAAWKTAGGDPPPPLVARPVAN